MPFFGLSPPLMASRRCLACRAEVVPGDPEKDTDVSCKLHPGEVRSVTSLGGVSMMIAMQLLGAYMQARFFMWMLSWQEKSFYSFIVSWTGLSSATSLAIVYYFHVGIIFTLFSLAALQAIMPALLGHKLAAHYTCCKKNPRGAAGCTQRRHIFDLPATPAVDSGAPPAPAIEESNTTQKNE